MNDGDIRQPTTMLYPEVQMSIAGTYIFSDVSRLDSKLHGLIDMFTFGAPS